VQSRESSLVQSSLAHTLHELSPLLFDETAGVEVKVKDWYSPAQGPSYEGARHVQSAHRLGGLWSGYDQVSGSNLVLSCLVLPCLVFDLSSG
jgi:hypothetical protein